MIMLFCLLPNPVKAGEGDVDPSQICGEEILKEISDSRLVGERCEEERAALDSKEV